MQQAQQMTIYAYAPRGRLAKNGLRITDIDVEGRTPYRVRDTSTGEEYFAAFIKHAGVYLMQPLEWLFDVGRFEPIGDPVQVVPGVEIIGTVTDTYELHRVLNAFEYEGERE